MTVAIHQPNFMPWCPFFQKMQAADVFVVLSHCQFEKNGYQNRFRLGDKWYTMSVRQGIESITAKQYINAPKDWARIKAMLPQCSDLLKAFDGCISESLMKTNTAIIRQIVQKMNIHTRIVPDFDTGLAATERLVALCKHYKADTYLSGISGKEYLDVSCFEREGIALAFQNEDQLDRRPILEVLRDHGKE